MCTESATSRGVAPDLGASSARFYTYPCLQACAPSPAQSSPAGGEEKSLSSRWIQTIPESRSSVTQMQGPGHRGGVGGVIPYGTRAAISAMRPERMGSVVILYEDREDIIPLARDNHNDNNN
ncbi:hypothetical protein CTA1_6713 [Colletotrichum tanaceti]|uniref:Uncharacterized protein n=1 Tax=Colletotrichum tanaceti TaxID=1306861 RepID=A0A4U6XPI6_9PEZI|nr:hypothetical protein CTA1_6713 [Colletotrichum tanaceti]